MLTHALESLNENHMEPAWTKSMAVGLAHLCNRAGSEQDSQNSLDTFSVITPIQHRQARRTRQKQQTKATAPLARQTNEMHNSTA